MNELTDKSLIDLLDNKFKKKYVNYCGIDYCEWETNWHVKILFNLTYSWVWVKWMFVYHDDIVEMVEYKIIQPILMIRSEFKKIIDLFELNPSKLIIKSDSILKLEQRLNTTAKLHHQTFGIWHISCKIPKHEVNISIITKAFYAPGEDLYEVMYNRTVEMGQSLSDIYKKIDSMQSSE